MSSLKKLLNEVSGRHIWGCVLCTHPHICRPESSTRSFCSGLKDVSSIYIDHHRESRNQGFFRRVYIHYACKSDGLDGNPACRTFRQSAIGHSDFARTAQLAPATPDQPLSPGPPGLPRSNRDRTRLGLENERRSRHIPECGRFHCISRMCNRWPLSYRGTRSTAHLRTPVLTG